MHASGLFGGVARPLVETLAKGKPNAEVPGYGLLHTYPRGAI